MASSQARLSDVPRRHENPVRPEQLLPGLLSFKAIANTDLEAFRALSVVTTGTGDLPLVGYATTGPVIGLSAEGVDSGQPFNVISGNVVKNLAWSWTPGSGIYLSGTAGGLASSGTVRIGRALTATSILLDLANATVGARTTRTSGNITLNSTSWANVDTGLDLVLPAQAGDIVEYGLSGQLESAAAEAYFDVATIVSGSPVNYMAGSVGPSTGEGAGAWWATTGVLQGIGGSIQYALQSGDIASGQVTLRLRYRESSATNRTLNASSTMALHVWAKVLH